MERLTKRQETVRNFLMRWDCLNPDAMLELEHLLLNEWADGYSDAIDDAEEN
jgi:hypothetical protein